MYPIQSIQDNLNIWFDAHPVAEAGFKLGEMLLFHSGLNRLSPGLPAGIPGIGLPIVVDLANWIIFDDYQKEDLYLTLYHSIVGSISGYMTGLSMRKEAHALGLIFGGLFSISSSIFENDGRFSWESAASNFAMVLGAHFVSGAHQFQRNKKTAQALKTKETGSSVEKYLTEQLELIKTRMSADQNLSWGYDTDIKTLKHLVKNVVDDPAIIKNRERLIVSWKEICGEIRMRLNTQVSQINRLTNASKDERVRKALSRDANSDDLNWYIREAEKCNESTGEFLRLAEAWGEKTHIDQYRKAVTDLRKKIERAKEKQFRFSASSSDTSGLTDYSLHPETASIPSSPSPDAIWVTIRPL